MVLIYYNYCEGKKKAMSPRLKLWLKKYFSYVYRLKVGHVIMLP